jgi:hypothetical protein
MTRNSSTAIHERAVLYPRDQNIFRDSSTAFQGTRGDKGFERPPSFAVENHVMKSMKEPLPSWTQPIEYRPDGTFCPSPLYDVSWIEEDNGSCADGFVELPEDFIPPRHHFVNKKGGNPPKRSETHRVKEALPEGFVHLRDMDVVCGRGAPTMLHPGNQAYRNLIQKHETDYLCAKRSDKPVIATQIMETLKRQGIRFVRKEGNARGWIALDETKIYEKVCQSLREGAPELRRKMLASHVRIKGDEKPQSWAGRLEIDQENCAPINR